MDERARNVARLAGERFDVLVVGGGVNGAVSAAALAARGAKVALVERGDFGGETSQASSNLVWGGIKYLETFEFFLVRQLCASRNRLFAAYPESIRESRFFTVIERGFRFPVLAIYLATWLYWLLGFGRTRRPRWLSRAIIARDEPTVALDRVRGGVEYSDGQLVDGDARFVFGLVRRALDLGACGVNYVELVRAERTASGFVAHLRDVEDGHTFTAEARVIVNAAGPFADDVATRLAAPTEHQHVFSKGIHLLVERVSPSDRVLTFFDETGRLFFVVPMGGRSVIGTTDTRADAPHTYVTAEDRDFLLRNANARLALTRPLGPEDVLSTRCGVRPLVVPKTSVPRGGVEWTKLSRKHVIEAGEGVVTIFGGKLTDCLNVGDEVAEAVTRLGVHLGPARELFYGEAPGDALQTLAMRLDALGLDRAEASRLHRRYGERAAEIVAAMESDRSLAAPVIDGGEVRWAELPFARDREMVTRLEDWVRRRTLLGLVVGRETLLASEALERAARLLFGERALEALTSYHHATVEPRREPMTDASVAGRAPRLSRPFDAPSRDAHES